MKKSGKNNQQEKKKSSKQGRNRRKCELYLLDGRFEDNKLRRLKKELTRNPNNTSAKQALKQFGISVEQLLGLTIN